MTTSPSTVASRARRRIAARVLPLVFCIYIVNYLDRANVAFAKLSMSKDLGFTEDIYGLVRASSSSAIWPSRYPRLIVERFVHACGSARILITWEVCTGFVGMVHTPTQFYLARFVLGLAEAGFYPGIIVYLTHWFSLARPARAMGTLILAIPVALGIGSARFGRDSANPLARPGRLSLAVYLGRAARGRAGNRHFLLPDRSPRQCPLAGDRKNATGSSTLSRSNASARNSRPTSRP